MGGSGPPSNTWFLGPTQVLNPSGFSIGSAVSAGLTSVTDQQTDQQTDKLTNHATRSVTIGCIYVRSTVIRPNNNILLLSFCLTLTNILSQSYSRLGELQQKVTGEDFLRTRCHSCCSINSV